MSRLILAIGFVFLLTSAASAQQYPPWGWEPHHSSTAQEGWLRGWGANARGWGYWMESMGQYENMHEDARKKYIENEAQRIRTRWELYDERKERIKAKYPDYHTREMAKLDREEKKLEVAARKLELEKKKAQMMADGLIPDPSKRKYTSRNGNEYENYATYKKSDEYKEYRRALEVRAAQRERERQAEAAAEK